nr:MULTISPECIES: hypothetical protein [Nostocales]
MIINDCGELLAFSLT